MGLTLTEKIIKDHLVVGEMVKGTEIGIRIDQTLTQDSTGTMAYMQLEAMEVPRVKTKRSLAYIDHNMLQEGPENMDDHIYIQTVAKKHGVYFSKPGNGICHQVEIERFGVPGQTLLGSDSHTPTGGGIGMLAIGAGGLDVAVAMAGGEYYITMPEVVKVELTGKLRKGVSSKDIILEVLRQCTVKGGINKVFEYTGDGVKTLTVPERATVTNMGAELGATTSVFPSDEMTKAFLEAQGRAGDFTALSADSDAVYDQVVKVDLSTLEPLTACPHSPDKVVKVSEIEGLKVNQVAIGSCTNSSWLDLMKVAAILKGQTVAENVQLVIAPGSKQVLTMLAENGALADLLNAGARILECGCGPCIGMGQAPCTDGVSLRTFNRNFKGRSGTVSADVYLLSPETAAISAVKGVLTNPLGKVELPDIEMPKDFLINDNAVIPPAPEGEKVEVIKGPNIKPFPLAKPLADTVEGKALIVVEDNITTDHIMPSNAKLLPYRSNIPYLADYCLSPCDPEFPQRAKDNHGGFIIGGQNYGQGSSREHAALAPVYLGIKGVITKSFARIHKNNLINNGILPMVFENEADYDKISLEDDLMIDHAREQVNTGKIVLKNKTKNEEYPLLIEVSERQKEMLQAGGLINLMRSKN
ncbi:aconitate hydratase [Eubacterium callanderi]|uniref:Aconitate hydratase n=1 Tax=Eubacterium callanderi TaxID=53442 RepID=E3GGK6_9FIRM|nr:aconitate hydratase [Eubacterium callanderi]OEZ05096.1 homoaconitase large subunit [[Butyribacterium] methylotrophicum]ADO38811.1 aconitate hydratase [Eubacterium callanderi]MCB6661581.1 aconitate hydratase [Eubacterium callanderi]MCB6754452.1 aconitate hydratase [Eubacterium callanderi]MCB7106155.1 aconitate hydratase [Eubacterium callanderi]